MRQAPTLYNNLMAAAAIGTAVMSGSACAEDRSSNIHDMTVTDAGSETDSGNGGQGGGAGAEAGNGGTGGTGACLDTETKCGSKCVDVYTDPDNCGGCGSICEGIKTACANAVCSCEVGLMDCNDGFCTDTYDDNDNCGGCGNVCDSGKHCEDGFCKQ